MAVLSSVCLFAFSLLYFGGSTLGYTPHFHSAREVGVLNSGAIDEASGLAASREHRNVLYTHNDSGGKNLLYAIDATNGRLLSTITISGAKSHDWEDIAVGPCPDGDKHCIYIADTGGNYHGAADVLYKVEEPDSVHHSTQTLHIGDSDMLHFSWDEDNCETIMVGRDAEIYLVSKNSHGRGKFFHVSKSDWGRSSVHIRSPTTLGTFSARNGPVGGDISPNGHEVLLKMLDHVLFWYIPHENYAEVLKQDPQYLPYHSERQGEAICWDSHGNDYFTVSEGRHPPLYRYTRID